MAKKIFTKFCVLLLFVFVVVQAQAQNQVQGKVINKNGDPISGATVSVDGGASSVVANNNGEFSIAANAKTITISAVGFKTTTVTISSKDAIVQVILEDEVVGLDAIVVTATNNPKRLQQTMPISITTFNEAKIAKIKFNSTADILRGTPGITAEGGGGEVASNVFVRGLPSGGQYQFTPLQIDGMPVIATMGLTSSAPDVYFRNDLGFSRIDFVRGGAATLYGAGSVAGIVNYTSKTGGDQVRSIVETEYATPGKARIDFNTGGPLGNQLYYNLAGTYRYDNGPIQSGIPSSGYQLRGNIKKITENGSVTIFGQYINDQVQFYSPFHLTSNRELPTGADGKKIYTMASPDVRYLSVRTPNGIYQSRAGNAVSTKGGYLMIDFVHRFENDWRINVKARSASYRHEFNFFNTDGTGRNPLTQTNFLTAIAPTGTAPVYRYANDNQIIPSNALIVENTIIDRNRPMNEIAAQANITKTIKKANASHTISIGTFASRTNQIDYNVQLRYLSEFNNLPKIVNLSYTNNLGAATNYSTNGVVSVPGYTNRDLTSNRLAFFLTEEASIGNWNIDAGFRVEQQTGEIQVEKTTTAANADGRNVAWGNGNFDRFKVDVTDWALALGISYKIKNNLSAYGNFSRGYFFPEYRGFNVRTNSGRVLYPESLPERVIQGEAGLKYSSKKFYATVAGYYVKLKDRKAVNLLLVGTVLREVQNLQSSRAYGVEVNYDWEFAKGFHLAGTGTIQNAVYTQFVDSSNVASPIDNKGKWLERQPRIMFSPSLSYENKGFFAGVYVDYFGKRFGNAANLVELDPYSLVRLDMAYTIKMKNGESVRFNAGIFNLFNSEAVTEGNPRAGNTQLNSGDFFVGRISLPRAFYTRVTLSF